MTAALAPTPPRPWPALLGAALFALAHTQGPLFYSNQNQYLLHGLADGGHGELAHDWLANTRDPTPVFSALVAVTYRLAGLFPLHVYHFVLIGAYAVSLAALVRALPGGPRDGPALLGFLALLAVVHAAALRIASVRLAGVDYPWFLQCGVANQYVLGPGLQPSAFGVLLIAALAAFLQGRLVLTVLCLAAACTLHATYLLPAAFLTLGFMHVLWWSGRRSAALWLGAGTLLLVLPVAVYGALAFAPTTADQFRAAQRLLAEFRIPHHAVVDRWLDGIAWGQIAWVVLGIALARGTPLFPLLLIPAALSAALSVVQVATGSPTLALLFPWRVSAVLVPVATAIVLARLVAFVVPRINERSVRLAGGVLLVGAAATGVAVMARGLGYHMGTEDLPVLAFVRERQRPGDVYLVPVTVPRLAAGKRGTASTTFTPPPRAAAGATLIPVDLQRFRLLAGAPIYVDFKSIPYKDVDVREWERRIENVERWYDTKDWARLRAELTREGITHVVTAAGRDGGAAGVLERVYADEHYRVYRLGGAAAE